jgi:aromatic ring-opening dioxygenase catalytic subunit (LigB family)
MTAMKLPTLFISHGGGPWPWIEESRADFAGTLHWLQQLPATFPAKPNAILSVSGHWEEQEFTVATSANPPMVYDYYGFPEHTYHIKYAASGSPSLAERVRSLLNGAGLHVEADAERGFDHGTFVPLAVMYPDAEVPIVSLSLRASLNASEHMAMGAALEPLREEGVLIVGSGLSYHNLRALRASATAGPVSEQFEAWPTPLHARRSWRAGPKRPPPVSPILAKNI